MSELSGMDTQWGEQSKGDKKSVWLKECPTYLGYDLTGFYYIYLKIIFGVNLYI